MDNAADGVDAVITPYGNSDGNDTRELGLSASSRVFPFSYSVVIACLAVISCALGFFLLRDDPEGIIAFSDLVLVATNAMASLALLYAAASLYKQKKEVYIAWLILSLATMIFTIGDAIWAYEEVFLKVDPLYSISNIFFLSYYPIFLLGIFSLPSLKFSFRERFKMALDIGIVMIAAVIMYWYFVIGPFIQESSSFNLITFIVNTGYPVGDLILLTAVMELLFKRIYGNEQTPLLFLAAGMMVLIVTDSIYFLMVWADTYAAGGVIDLGWPISYVLIGLAGMSEVNILAKRSRNALSDRPLRYGELTWTLYLPYICAVGAFALLIWSHEDSVGLSFYTISMAVGIIIAMVILRQILVLNENARLYEKAQEDIRERELAQAEVIRLNEELEELVAQRTMELENANKELKSEVQERIQAEAAMRDSERRMADIINFLPDATFVINKEGAVIAWNRAIEKMTSVRAEDMLGRGNYEYSLPFYKERRPILVDLVLNPDHESESRYDELKRHEDNSLVGVCFTSNLKGNLTYLLGSAAVLYDSEGKVYGAIESIRDITDRKMVEEDLKNARDRAESATRSKSNFLANMSHEIRTPMNAVIGMAGLLLESDLKPEQRDYLETIRNSGNSLLAIINDILDYSKIDGEKMELEILPFDLMGCIEISVDLVAAKAAEKGLELTYFQEESVPRAINGDEIRLRQVLVNLLGNATKFTERGEIVLYLSSTPLDDGRVELHFKVKDTGIGISEENLSRLFQFFTQVDSSTTRHYGGTGLGLAISRKLVEMMEGKIWVESEREVGSTFHFTIRCHPCPDDDHSDPGEMILSGMRVMIVEGHEMVREMLAQIARSWKMEVVALAAATEVMQLLKEERVTTLSALPKTNSFDFVILDAILPDMDGLHLARQIRAEKAAPHLVMISRIGEKLQRDGSISGWLTKPVKPRLLKNLLVDLVSHAKETNEPEAHSAISSEKCSDLSILLAEDNPVNQKVALIMLKHLHYNADLACSGPEVLTSVKRKHYDVILMDIQMPDIDGLEATRLIRKMCGSDFQPYIIAMTAYALDGDRQEILKNGMNDYLSKPIQIEELKSALKRFEEIRKV